MGPLRRERPAAGTGSEPSWSRGAAAFPLVNVRGFVLTTSHPLMTPRGLFPSTAVPCFGAVTSDGTGRVIAVSRPDLRGKTASPLCAGAALEVMVAPLARMGAAPRDERRSPDGAGALLRGAGAEFRHRGASLEDAGAAPIPRWHAPVSRNGATVRWSASTLRRSDAPMTHESATMARGGGLAARGAAPGGRS